MASSSQRSRSGFTSFSITDGSGTGWFKNSGATSGPPVSNKPCICSSGILRRAAFQTLRSGYLEKNGVKYFSSERRIQVARLGIPNSNKGRPVSQTRREGAALQGTAPSSRRSRDGDFQPAPLINGRPGKPPFLGINARE